jgi:Gluconate 2-dehydrogenase subunit 3
MTMNRRKAISLAALAGLGAAMTGAAYKYWTLARTPDLARLHQNPALLEALCETILPEGDTPGATTARVPAFIARMISDCTPRNEQNTFISGLQEV